MLATQAALGAMSRSRLVSHPAALGAGRGRRRWTFDFMGASKWFFSLSGTILLIGALAIGGKGLNFGIDFKSGTRIQTAFVRAGDRGPGLRSDEVGRRPGRARSRKSRTRTSAARATRSRPGRCAPKTLKQVEASLNSRFGLRNFSSKSIGPTFGKTVANSAVIAIIASLLVISAYIALRFEWKYAVPVLIALMHDLLITAGVYSLTGREVTAATVAALLTILGYSLYDTIIVFDRVRERRAEDAAGGLLADRQPLHVRGADPIAGDDLLHAAAGDGAAVLRRGNAEGLRVRAAHRDRVRRLLVDLHRLSGAHALEGTRADLPSPARADRPGTGPGPGVRDHGFGGARGHRARAEAPALATRGASSRRRSRGPSSPARSSGSSCATSTWTRSRAATPAAAGRAKVAQREREEAPPEPEPQPQADPAADLTPEDLVLKEPPKRRQKSRRAGGRRTNDTAGPADGRPRLGDDGARDLALHDLPARPLLGRDRRRVRRLARSGRSSSG